MTYHFGPGPARVHLKLEFDWKLAPAYDVIARLRGTDLADQWIIRGNHHDAWVHGANDPVSGMVALMEEARAIGELAKSGWRPRRTLIFAAWDGEEQGLLGSTEWVETHIAELREHAVVYINSDSNGRGFLDAGGSHTLERFVNEVARDVDGPAAGRVGAGASRARQLVDEEDADERKKLRERSLIELGALGSGSDYSPFLQHAGIAALNIGYGGEGEYGVYHSAYDSFDHYLRFRRPDVRVRAGAGEDDGPDDAPPGERRLPSVRGDEPRADGVDVPRRGDEARGEDASGDRRAQPDAARAHAGARGRSDEAVRRAELAGAGAVPRVRTAAERAGAVAEGRPRTTAQTRTTTASRCDWSARSRATRDCRSVPGIATTSTRLAPTPATA